LKSIPFEVPTYYSGSQMNPISCGGAGNGKLIAQQGKLTADSDGQ